MKTSLFNCLSVLLLIVASITAAGQQIPQKMNYQGVARNSSGVLLTNRNIGLRFSIHETSAAGPEIFTETMTAMTNNYGTFTAEIGGGTPVYGSFATISWSTGQKYLQIQMDPNGGTNYTDMGTYPILSVAYAQYAKNVLNNDDADPNPNNEIQSLSVSGDQLSISSGNTVTLPTAPASPAGGDLTGSYPNPSIATSAVNSQKIQDLTIINADIADATISSAKMSGSGATANQVLYYNGSNVSWGYAPGAVIGYYYLNANCSAVATFTSTYIKIADIGSFTKIDATSKLEITFNGRVYASSLTGTGAVFELRLDGNATTNGRVRANIKSAEVGGDGVPVSMTGVFTGYGSGSHTVSIWVRTSTGTGTNGGFDPGCWTTDHVIVREVK